MKMKETRKKGVGILVLTVGLCFAALHGAAAGEKVHIDLSVGITPGKEYTHTKWFVIIPVKLTPQMAVWIEDTRGRFAGSIYVTEKAFEGSWKGGGDISRPEALPVYFDRFPKGGVQDNGTQEKGADAVSGATPKQKDGKSHEWSRSFVLEPGEYRVMAEVNSSFDYNDAYQKEDDNVNGQPSLIYAAEFEVGPRGIESPDSLVLQPFGHGDPLGESGEIVEGTEGLTSALELLDKVYAEVK